MNAASIVKLSDHACQSHGAYRFHLRFCRKIGKALAMAKDGKETLSREERLAAKLRENLRRRKAQGREHGGMSDEGTQSGVPKGSSES